MFCYIVKETTERRYPCFEYGTKKMQFILGLKGHGRLMFHEYLDLPKPRKTTQSVCEVQIQNDFEAQAMWNNYYLYGALETQNLLWKLQIPFEIQDIIEDYVAQLWAVDSIYVIRSFYFRARALAVLFQENEDEFDYDSDSELDYYMEDVNDTIAFFNRLETTYIINQERNNIYISELGLQAALPTPAGRTYFEGNPGLVVNILED